MVAHRDLEGMTLRKEFCRELYYRLNAFPICVRPLRQRAEDIPLIVKHFILPAAKRMTKTVGWVSDEDHGLTLEEVEHNHILATLKQARWVLSGSHGAATRLGMNRSRLHFRIKKLGIFRSLEASFNQNKYSEASSRLEGD